MSEQETLPQNPSDTRLEVTSIRLTIKSPSSGNSDSGEINTEIPKNKSILPTFSSIAQEFVTLLQMLWKYMNEIGVVAEKTTLANLISVPLLLREIIKREKNSKEDEKPIADVVFELRLRDDNGNEDLKTIKASIFDLEHFETIQEFSQYHNAALRILNETALQQIVNSYEKVLGEILTWYLHTNPDAAPKDKEINYSQLLSFNSMAEAKRFIIDKEIENFLKRKGIDDQLKYLKKELKADLNSHFNRIAEFKELMLRRHAIVHAGGIATAEYMRRVKKVSGLKLDAVEGESLLPLTAKYVRNSWNVVFALGVILLHLVAKANARSIKSKDDEDEADKFLINSAYSCIENRQFDAAESILQYAKKLRLVKDASNLMVVINLAQTYLWQGKKKHCSEILNSYDWNAYATTFQLCVAALKNDFKRFEELLPEVASQKAITFSQICSWPVFRLMHSNENFQILIKRVFGENIQSLPDACKPRLFNPKPEKTIKSLIGSFDEEQTT